MYIAQFSTDDGMFLEGGQVFIEIYFRFPIDFRHRTLYSSYNIICLIFNIIN